MTDNVDDLRGCRVNTVVLYLSLWLLDEYSKCIKMTTVNTITLSKSRLVS